MHSTHQVNSIGDIKMSAKIDLTNEIKHSPFVLVYVGDNEKHWKMYMPKSPIKVWDGMEGKEVRLKDLHWTKACPINDYVLVFIEARQKFVLKVRVRTTFYDDVYDEVNIYTVLKKASRRPRKIKFILPGRNRYRVFEGGVNHITPGVES